MSSIPTGAEKWRPTLLRSGGGWDGRLWKVFYMFYMAISLPAKVNDATASDLNKVTNTTIRMVFQPQDAEEVTQEVLRKAITRLSTFHRESKFRTWPYRIAANHELNMERRGGEQESQTFSNYADAINGTPDLDLPDPKSVPVDVPLLVEEAKISCTTGMLLSLDRKQRLIFVLAVIWRPNTRQRHFLRRLLERGNVD